MYLSHHGSLNIDKHIGSYIRTLGSQLVDCGKKWEGAMHSFGLAESRAESRGSNQPWPTRERVQRIPFASLSAISSQNRICLQLHRPHGHHRKSLRFILISFRVQHKYGAELTRGAGQKTPCPLQLIPEYLTSSPKPIPPSREYSPSQGN